MKTEKRAPFDVAGRVNDAKMELSKYSCIAHVLAHAVASGGTVDLDAVSVTIFHLHDGLDRVYDALEDIEMDFERPFLKSASASGASWNTRNPETETPHE